MATGSSVTGTRFVPGERSSSGRFTIGRARSGSGSEPVGYPGLVDLGSCDGQHDGLGAIDMWWVGNPFHTVEVEKHRQRCPGWYPAQPGGAVDDPTDAVGRSISTCWPRWPGSLLSGHAEMLTSPMGWMLTARGQRPGQGHVISNRMYVRLARSSRSLRAA